MPVVYKLKNYGEAPKDSVIIPRTEAANLVWDSVCDLGFWKSLPYKGGYAALAFCTGLSSMMITGKLRKFFKVGKYGYFSTVIPAAYVPVIANFLLHKVSVAPPILLQENICPTCLQVRSMGIQLATGIVFPFTSSYFITYMTATHLGTVVAPQIKLLRLSSARAEMIDVFKKSTRKLVSPIIMYSIMHCTVACAIVMLQMYMMDGTMQDVEKKRLTDIEEINKNMAEKRYREQKYSVLSTVV